MSWDTAEWLLGIALFVLFLVVMMRGCGGLMRGGCGAGGCGMGAEPWRRRPGAEDPDRKQPPPPRREA